MESVESALLANDGLMSLPAPATLAAVAPRLKPELLSP